MASRSRMIIDPALIDKSTHQRCYKNCGIFVGELIRCMNTKIIGEKACKNIVQIACIKSQTDSSHPLTVFFCDKWSTSINMLEDKLAATKEMKRQINTAVKLLKDRLIENKQRKKQLKEKNEMVLRLNQALAQKQQSRPISTPQQSPLSMNDNRVGLDRMKIVDKLHVSLQCMLSPTYEEPKFAVIETNMNNRQLTDITSPADVTPLPSNLFVQGHSIYSLLDECQSPSLAQTGRSTQIRPAEPVATLVHAFHSNVIREFNKVPSRDISSRRSSYRGAKNDFQFENPNAENDKYTTNKILCEINETSSHNRKPASLHRESGVIETSSRVLPLLHDITIIQNEDHSQATHSLNLATHPFDDNNGKEDIQGLSTCSTKQTYAQPSFQQKANQL